MATGKIKWYDAPKGYGFIIPDDGTVELFFHYSEMESKERLAFYVEKNVAVSYDPAENEKGNYAKTVRRIECLS